MPVAYPIAQHSLGIAFLLPISLCREHHGNSLCLVRRLVLECFMARLGWCFPGSWKARWMDGEMGNGLGVPGCPLAKGQVSEGRE